MLDKEISLDEKVDALPDDSARLLWTWLIPHLDREGRMYGDANLVKSIVIPRLSWPLAKVEKYLQAIEKLGLIRRYEVNGHLYLDCPKFKDHQKGLELTKEAASRLPNFPGETATYSRPTRDLLATDPPKNHLEGEGKGRGREGEVKENIKVVVVEDAGFEDPEFGELCKHYESNVGKLTPIIAGEIQDAKQEYGFAWTKEAIEIAVKGEHRKWSYILGILESWKRDGKNTGPPGHKPDAMRNTGGFSERTKRPQTNSGIPGNGASGAFRDLEERDKNLS